MTFYEISVNELSKITDEISKYKISAEALKNDNSANKYDVSPTTETNKTKAKLSRITR